MRQRYQRSRADNGGYSQHGPDAMARARAHVASEAEFILDTLAGELPLDAFDGDWACFSRYCAMQADTAARNGHAELAGVMRAAGNRAARNAGVRSWRRTAAGYAATYAVQWGGYKRTAPCLMGWAVEVARRMRARGHKVSIVRVAS